MKKMMFVFLLLAISVAVQAQDMDKWKEKKAEYVKKKLALTADEEKKFTPVYENFQNEMQELRKKFQTDVDLGELDLTFKTDAECEQIINDIIAFRQGEVDIIKKYTAEFKKVLPIKKVAMIFKAEAEFKKSIVKKLVKERAKNRRNGNGGGNGNGNNNSEE